MANTAGMLSNAKTVAPNFGGQRITILPFGFNTLADSLKNSDMLNQCAASATVIKSIDDDEN